MNADVSILQERKYPKAFLGYFCILTGFLVTFYAILLQKGGYISKTETVTDRREKQDEAIGKRVSHSVFGIGTVIGKPRDQEGFIVQFDAMVTPRTFTIATKLAYIS